MCARVHACFLFAMGMIEFGAFFYKNGLLFPVLTGCDCKPGALTKAAGGQGGKWA